jgi:hypothetical protein
LKKNTFFIKTRTLCQWSLFLVTFVPMIYFQSIEGQSFEKGLNIYYEIEIDNLSVERVTENYIIGTFNVYNPTDIYFTNILIASELYIDTKDGITNLLNKKVDTIFLPSKKLLSIRFEHEIPPHIPDEDIRLRIRSYNRTGIPFNFVETYRRFPKYSSIGFLLNDSTESYIEKDGEQLDELSGPTYSINESPLLVLKMKNISENKLEVYPKIEVFERSYFTNLEPVVVSLGSNLTFEPNETKEVKIQLPKMTKPESYLSGVRFLNVLNDEQISSVVEARYVVVGPSARILEKLGKIDQNTLTVNYILIGPADGSSLENVTLKINVFDQDLKEIYSSNQMIEFLGDSPINKEIIIPAIVEQQAYSVLSDVFYQDEILDSADYFFGDLDPLDYLEDENPSEPNGFSFPNNENPEKQNSYRGILVIGVLIFILLGVVLLKYKKKFFDKNNTEDHWE